MTCGGQYYNRGLVCTRADAMIMTYPVEVNVSANVSLVWRSWKSPGERAAWQVITSAKTELLRRVNAREKEVANIRDIYDKEEDRKGVWYMIKKYFGFHRPWRPAWNAGGEGRGICYNATAVQKAADAAARVAQIDSSKTRAKEFDRALKCKSLASFAIFSIQMMIPQI